MGKKFESVADISTDKPARKCKCVYCIYLLDVFLCSIAEYFYQLCCILTSQNTNNEFDFFDFDSDVISPPQLYYHTISGRDESLNAS